MLLYVSSVAVSLCDLACCCGLHAFHYSWLQDVKKVRQQHSSEEGGACPGADGFLLAVVDCCRLSI